MANRDSFLCYRSFYESIESLPDDKDKLKLYQSIFEFALNHKCIELTGIQKTVFTLIKPQLEANYKKYLNGLKGAKYGIKGGRPTKNKNPKETPKKPQTDSKETPNDNVNDNVNVNVNDNNTPSKSKNLDTLYFEEWWNLYSYMRKKIYKEKPELKVGAGKKKVAQGYYKQLLKRYSHDDILTTSIGYLAFKFDADIKPKSNEYFLKNELLKDFPSLKEEFYSLGLKLKKGVLNGFNKRKNTA